MAGGVSQRERREVARAFGSAPRSRRVPEAIRDRTVLTARSRWLAIAVVAGLFAMHGLGMHGAHSAGASSAMHAESVSPARDMPAVGMSAAGSHDGVTALPALTADMDAMGSGLAKDGSSDLPGGAGLVGLCLALLIFLMVWLRRWTSSRLAWIVPRRTLEACVAQLSVTARDLSPPLRAELSIWRC